MRMFFIRLGRIKNSFVAKIRLFGEFVSFLYSYSKGHAVRIIVVFEGMKNALVHFFQMKRGRYTRPFLHGATILVIGLGVMVTPLLADTFPLFAAQSQGLEKVPNPNSTEQSIAVDSNVFQTQVSSQLRSKIIDYTVERVDTVSSIAQKFGISEDTIRWEDNLTDDSLTVGDSLKILPVTGVEIGRA